jgi:hypothetical protein
MIWWISPRSLTIYFELNLFLKSHQKPPCDGATVSGSKNGRSRTLRESDTTEDSSRTTVSSTLVHVASIHNLILAIERKDSSALIAHCRRNRSLAPSRLQGAPHVKLAEPASIGPTSSAAAVSYRAQLVFNKPTHPLRWNGISAEQRLPSPEAWSERPPIVGCLSPPSLS